MTARAIESVGCLYFLIIEHWYQLSFCFFECAGFWPCATVWCTSSWQLGCCMGCCWTNPRSFLWSRVPVLEELLPTKRRKKKTWDSEAWAGSSSENYRTWWVARTDVHPALNCECLLMSVCAVVQRLIEEENMLAPSLQQFSLRTEMLPSYIPIRVAEKILFVGESVQMFENHNHSPSRAGTGSFCCNLLEWDLFFLCVWNNPTCFLCIFRLYTETPGRHVCCWAASTQTADAFQPGGFWEFDRSHKEHSGRGELIRDSIIFSIKEGKLASCFYKALMLSYWFAAPLDSNGGRGRSAWAAQGLSSSPLVLHHKSAWNEPCWCLCFLCSQIIKDFYLLGRGELYQVFIDLAQHMLKTPPTAVTEHGKYSQTGSPLCLFVHRKVTQLNTVCSCLSWCVHVIRAMLHAKKKEEKS